MAGDAGVGALGPIDEYLRRLANTEERGLAAVCKSHRKAGFLHSVRPNKIAIWRVSHSREQTLFRFSNTGSQSGCKDSCGRSVGYSQSTQT